MATISYGTFTIVNELDGSQFWTTTVEPVSPDYTFTISDLVGDTNADIKVGDVILYSHYRYTVLNINQDGATVRGGNRESLRGVDGISPTVKSIVSSHAAVVCEKDGAYNPDTIKFRGQAVFENSVSDYQGWFVIELSSDAETWVTNYTSASKESFVNYKIPLGLNITKDGILYYQGSEVTTNGSIVDENFTISSEGVISTTQDIGFIIRSIRCNLYSDANRTELVDQQRVNIAFDGVDGDKGDDGYTIVLTNENHTFSGDTDSAIKADVECEVIAYRGSIKIPSYIGTITGCPTGMTANVSLNNATNSKFVVSVTQEMVSQNGVLDVPVTVEKDTPNEKTFNMKFTYSLKLNGLDATGLGWMVNYSTPTTPNDGECIYFGFDEVTKKPSYEKSGWVLWNGQEITIPYGCFVNPNDTMPYNTTIYSVYRLPSSTTYTNGIFHDVAWVESTNSWRSNTYNGNTPTVDTSSWVWNEDTDIILAMYVEPSNEGAITNAQLFTPPKKYSELVEVAKGMAKDAEKVAYYYMVTEPSTGTMIADMSDGVQRLPSTVNDKRNILLTDTEIKIRDGQQTLASYGTSITLGKDTGKHLNIDNSSGINIKNGKTTLASYGDTIVLGEVGENKKNIYITSGGMDVRDNTTSLANFGNTVRIGKLNDSHLLFDSSKMSAYAGTDKVYEIIVSASEKYYYSSLVTKEDGADSVVVNSSIPDTIPTVATISIIVEFLLEDGLVVSENYSRDYNADAPFDSLIKTYQISASPITGTDSPFKGYGFDIKLQYSTSGSGTKITVTDTDSATKIDSIRVISGVVLDENILNPHYRFGTFDETLERTEGSYSFATGIDNHVAGDYSFGAGIENQVSSLGGSVFGQYNRVTGDFAQAHGNSNYAYGACSLVGGEGSVTRGDYSMAHGLGVSARGEGSFACGRYNIPSSSYIFTAGNGSETDGYSNAFWIAYSGNCGIKGSLQTGSGLQVGGQMRSYNSAHTATHPMFITEDVTSSSITIGANGVVTGSQVSVAKTNYTAVGIGGMRILGTNNENCNVYSYKIMNNDHVTFSVKNHGTASATVTVEFTIYYISTTAFGS